MFDIISLICGYKYTDYSVMIEYTIFSYMSYHGAKFLNSTDQTVKSPDLQQTRLKYCPSPSASCHMILKPELPSFLQQCLKQAQVTTTNTQSTVYVYNNYIFIYVNWALPLPSSNSGK